MRVTSRRSPTRSESSLALRFTTASACSVAGPCVIFRPVDYMGPHGIEFDVTSTSQQVGARLNGAAFESSFPGGPGSSFELVEPPRVPASEALHKQAEVGYVITRVHDQVYVIRHKAVRIDMNAEFLAKLA